MPYDENKKQGTTFWCECDYCHTEFWLHRTRLISKKRNKGTFCTRECGYKSLINRKSINCTQCNSTFTRKPSEMVYSINQFCSHSCSATYNNQHKTHGTRVSKLEVWLREQLTTLYPTLEIHYNQKDAINSELDIYIPSMKLAFELNGIFHYEPIYGGKKLEQIQNNDTRKFAACQNAGISLCIIDTSMQKYFKPKTSQKFLDIIVNIISPFMTTGFTN